MQRLGDCPEDGRQQRGDRNDQQRQPPPAMGPALKRVSQIVDRETLFGSGAQLSLKARIRLP
jgi:hypothetical protein